ncbi:hypothetical protein GIB67_022211, partial [Kingdonia uniflora]
MAFRANSFFCITITWRFNTDKIILIVLQHRSSFTISLFFMVWRTFFGSWLRHCVEYLCPQVQILPIGKGLSLIFFPNSLLLVLCEGVFSCWGLLVMLFWILSSLNLFLNVSTF